MLVSNNCLYHDDDDDDGAKLPFLLLLLGRCGVQRVRGGINLR